MKKFLVVPFLAIMIPATAANAVIADIQNPQRLPQRITVQPQPPQPNYQVQQPAYYENGIPVYNGQQPAQGQGNGQYAKPYNGQPAQPYNGQPAQPYNGQPAQPYTGQPAQPYDGQPAQGSNVQGQVNPQDQAGQPGQAVSPQRKKFKPSYCQTRDASRPPLKGCEE